MPFLPTSHSTRRVPSPVPRYSDSPPLKTNFNKSSPPSGKCPGSTLAASLSPEKAIHSIAGNKHKAPLPLLPRTFLQPYLHLFDYKQRTAPLPRLLSASRKNHRTSFPHPMGHCTHLHTEYLRHFASRQIPFLIHTEHTFQSFVNLFTGNSSQACPPIPP